MKINILTFQFAKNYGAILQAHALSSYIKNDLHEECEIIQYWPERSDASWNMYYRGFEPKVILRNIFVFFNIKFKREFRAKNQVMQKAISELLPLTKERYTRESILKHPLLPMPTFAEVIKFGTLSSALTILHTSSILQSQ
ncbi:hypothetical protein [Bacteroides faecis]|uniref:hypothetical protein n=1 Tax=Bacteroides faecis TaxID=674529 RepID=UPI00286DA7EB|nr:hypothetical protein [Bacteroides faecis]MCS2236491.1 hypothetical protein [Bacteroides faecis]